MFSLKVKFTFSECKTLHIIWWILTNVYTCITQIHIKVRSLPSSWKYPSCPFPINLCLSFHFHLPDVTNFLILLTLDLFVYLVLYIIGIIQYRLFCVRLLSLTLMILEVIYVFSCTIAHFFYCWNIFHFINVPVCFLFINSWDISRFWLL